MEHEAYVTFPEKYDADCNGCEYGATRGKCVLFKLIQTFFIETVDPETFWKKVQRMIYLS